MSFYIKTAKAPLFLVPVAYLNSPPRFKNSDKHIMMHYLLVALSVASAASAAVTTVTVGSGGFVFNPNNITAAVNDTVIFVFSGS